MNLSKLTSAVPGAFLPTGAVGAVLRDRGAADVPTWLIIGSFVVFALWAGVLMWQLVYTTVCTEARARRVEGARTSLLQNEDGQDRRLASVREHGSVPPITG